MPAGSGPRRIASALLLLLTALWPGTASAWTEETRARMIRQSTELMPTSLREILQQLELSCLRGARISTAAGGREEEHRGRDGEEAAERIDRTVRAVRETIRAIREHESFRRIAHRFGHVAHLVSDLNFPPNLPEGSGIDGAAYERYRQFAEKAMERFTLVLDPADPAPLARDELEKYLRGIAARAGEYGPPLEEIFLLEERIPDPIRFDDRSVAFGIASLSYSRSVSDVSRVWLYIWHEANGDMDGVPFPLFDFTNGEEG